MDLTEAEIRVLWCLPEKQRTTPHAAMEGLAP
jgi:uncharacterized protein YceH (UPF0502 family)